MSFLNKQSPNKKGRELLLCCSEARAVLSILIERPVVSSGPDGVKTGLGAYLMDETEIIED